MEAVRPRVPRAPLATACGCLLIVFLVLLPKGGIRFLAGIPLTWGYLLLAIFAPLALVVRLLAMPLRFPVRVMAAVLLLVPMQVLFVYAGVAYGVESMQFTVSTFVGLFGLPWIFLLAFAPYFPMLDADRLARWFRNCVFYAAIYGIFLFVLHPITGHFIEIPYVTINAADYGELETTKSIARGFFLKLISTYNNGNLYGVSTLIILPIFLRLEGSRFRRFTVRLALLLTLSRTVWVGLIFHEVLSLALQLGRQVRTFPVLYLGAAKRRFIGVMATLALVFVSVAFTGFSGHYAQFLFDASLGSRMGEVEVAQHPTFLPSRPLYGFQEVLYASAAEYWGFTGLIAFTLIMVSPVLFLFWDPRVLNSPMKRAALKGLLIYMVLAAGDGALDYIPVMAFYWFTYAVFLCDWPGGLPQYLRVRRRAPAPVASGPDAADRQPGRGALSDLAAFARANGWTRLLGRACRSAVWRVRDGFTARQMKAPGFRAERSPRLLGLSHIRLGRDFHARDFLWLEAVVGYSERAAGDRFEPQLTIGHSARLSDNVHIACLNRVTIGDHLLCGSRILISDHAHGAYGAEAASDPTLPPALRPLMSSAPVVIGDNVWLGDGVVVLAGAEIGDGCVVGANSVVTGRIPARTIAVGAPARAVRRWDGEARAWVRIGDSERTGLVS